MSDRSDDDGGSPDPAVDEVFAALGNDKRVAILRTLWEATVPGQPPSESALTFSELQDSVGVADSGGFNYHLEKLTDRFVERTDEGYVLRPAGGAVVRSVLRGTLTGDASVEGDPVGVDCPLCGGDVLISYEDDRVFFRCSACEGSYRLPGYPEGTLTSFPAPPVVLLNRDAREVVRDATLWAEYQHRLMMKGVCPECSGTVSTTVEACDDHHTDPGHVCETCRSVHPVRYLHVCDVCRYFLWGSAMIHVFSDPTVEAFYAERGIGSFGPDYFRIWPDTVGDQTVLSRDPFRVRVDLSVEGDALSVTLDGEGRVVEVAEDPPDTE